MLTSGTMSTFADLVDQTAIILGIEASPAAG